MPKTLWFSQNADPEDFWDFTMLTASDGADFWVDPEFSEGFDTAVDLSHVDVNDETVWDVLATLWDPTYLMHLVTGVETGISFENSFVVATGDGRDYIIGGPDGDGDWLAGGAGADYIDGYEGDDTIKGDQLNADETGFDGNDSLWGGNGDDLIYGQGGNDELGGNHGTDTLVGGSGDDTYFITTSADRYDQVVEEAGGGIDTIVLDGTGWILQPNVENLRLAGSVTERAIIEGNAAGNSIRTAKGVDTIYGYEGNDTLDGGQGADWMVGGTGNDTYVVDNATDHVVEKAGGGIDTVQTTLSAFNLFAEVENVTALGTADFSSVGTAVGNTMVGNAGWDNLSGMDGNDALMGKAGNDTLDGGTGADWMTGDEGNDRVWGQAGRDTMLGGAGDDWMYGGDDGDAMTGGDGVDFLLGQAGEDSMDGGAGVDDLQGGDGHDTMRGGDDADGLRGDSGHDRIYGDAGNDTITGGAGADQLWGGAGGDLFVFKSIADSNAAGGIDTIQDFAMRAGDRIDLAAIDADTTVAGNQAFHYNAQPYMFASPGDLWAKQVLGGLMVYGDVNGDTTADFQVLLSNVTAVTADTFIL